MEFSLNAVWLLLAVAGMYSCARYQISLNRSRPDFLRAVLATSILCIFLFPVISATDDLHPTQALIEEANSRKTVSGISAAPLSGLLDHSAVFLLLLSFTAGAATFCSFDRVLDSPGPVMVAGLPTRHDGRAPPSFVRYSN